MATLDLRIPVSYSGPVFHPSFRHPAPMLDFQGLLEDLFGRLLRGAEQFRANYGIGLRNFADSNPDVMEEAVYNGLPQAIEAFVRHACDKQETLEFDLGSSDQEEMIREELLKALNIRLPEAQQRKAMEMERKDFLAAVELAIETGGDLDAFPR